MDIIVDAITYPIDHQLSFTAMAFILTDVVRVLTVAVLTDTVFFVTATAITTIPGALKDIAAIITLTIASASQEFTVFYD